MGSLGYSNELYYSDPSNFGRDVDLGDDVVIEDLQNGDDHSCILSTDGDVKCWGYNYYGQLGYGHSNDLGDESGEMGDDLQVVDLGSSFTVTQIGSGQDHMCAINDNYEMKCWGRNDRGMLGYGHENNLGDDADEMGDDLPIIDLGTDFRAHKLVMGNLFTCVISTMNDLKCFGRGNLGQLGNGQSSDSANLGDDPNEMGTLTWSLTYFSKMFFFSYLLVTFTTNMPSLFYCCFQVITCHLSISDLISN